MTNISCGCSNQKNGLTFSWYSRSLTEQLSRTENGSFARYLSWKECNSFGKLGWLLEIKQSSSKSDAQSTSVSHYLSSHNDCKLLKFSVICSRSIHQAPHQICQERLFVSCFLERRIVDKVYFHKVFKQIGLTFRMIQVTEFSIFVTDWLWMIFYLITW